jgi:hypothetical protein
LCSLPDVYDAQYLFSEGSVAIISDEITLVLPATSSTPLEFLHLPLVNGMVCQPMTDLGNTVMIRYQRTTGYQICRGIKKAADEVQVVLADHNSCVHFAESVRSRVAKRFMYSSPVLKPKRPPRRTSYASIDLNQSSEASLESDDDTHGFPRVPESNIEVPLLSRPKTQVQAEGDRDMQERAAGSSILPSHVQLNFISPVSSNRPPIESSSDIQASRDRDFIKLSSMPKRATLSTQTTTPALLVKNDIKRRLKRPGTKAVQITGNDVDWDEDLRDIVAEPVDPAKKKPKAASTYAKKAKNVARRKNLQPKSKGVDIPKNTRQSNAKLTRKIATNTQTRCTTTKKPAKYVENSKSDSESQDEDRASPAVQDCHPLVSKKVPLKEDSVQIDDSQGQEKDGLKSYDLSSINTPRLKGASFPHQALADVEEAAQDEEANDSHPMDAMARAEVLTRNDASFGTKLTQALTANACLRVPTVGRSPKRPFGNVKKFVAAVNDAKNGSPQKDPSKKPRSSPPANRKDVVHRMPSNAQSPADSHARHSLAQSQAAGPESCVSLQSPEGGNQQNNGIQTAPEAAVALERDPQQVLSKSVEPKNDVVDTPTTTTNRSEEIQAHDFNIGDKSSETDLPKRATAAAKWSASKQQSPKVVHDICKGIITQKSMGPPPLPRRSERRNIQSSNHMTSKGGNISSRMTDGRAQQKTPIIGFGTHGPRNQGVVLLGQQPKLANACVSVPEQTGRHAAAKRQKKVVMSEPITLPQLAAARGGANDQSPDNVDKGEGILMQENAFESTAISPRVHVIDGDEIVRAQVGSAVEEIPAAKDILRRNAWQLSRVDKNGSPRLLQTRKVIPYAANLEEVSDASAHSGSSGVTSDELEHSMVTDESNFSPIPLDSKRPWQKAFRPIKSKMMQSRVSIGLGDILSAKYPDAAKVMNTATFKKRTEFALSKAPFVVEKASASVRNVPQPKPSIQQIIPVEADHDSLFSSPQQHLLSDPNTPIVRLGPEPPADTPIVVAKASPTPTSFETGFKNILLPYPPLPPVKQGQRGQMAHPTSKGKRKGGPAANDEDLTLINDDDFIQHGHLTNRCWSDPTPDSYTDSQSSTMLEHVQPRKNPDKGARGAWPTEMRTTQQHMLNTLNQIVHVSYCHGFLRYNGLWLRLTRYCVPTSNEA